jgi:RNA polymerase sigma factor (TIGR02999 family)
MANNSCSSFSSTMSEVTQLLDAVSRGEARAAEDLLPLVYAELRQLAVQRLAQEKPGQTLQPTALVHEAYLRLVGEHDEERWDHRGHFFAAAAEAMRRILVEQARRKRAKKHGGGLVRHDADELEVQDAEPREDLIALDEALTKLQQIDAAAAQLVAMRYFAGLTQAETAIALGVSPRTADRLWTYARAWLHRELCDS